MFGLGYGELILIAVVVLVLFGGKRLPLIGSSLGQALRNFKKGVTGEVEDKSNEEANKDSK